jgi:hypothetical protein
MVHLSDMSILGRIAGNDQLALPALVRHLDDNVVMEHPKLKTSVVEVIIHLACQSKVKAPVAVVGAMNDLLRHLRKSIEYTMESAGLSNPGASSTQKRLQHSLEQCLIELAKRVHIPHRPLNGLLSLVQSAALHFCFVNSFM